MKRLSIGDIVLNFDKNNLDELIDLINRNYEATCQFNAWTCISPEILNEHLTNDETIRKPLSLVPVGVKDIFNTKRFPTEMGSEIWKGFTPGNDARVVSMLESKGASVVGKTVTAEFAVHELNSTTNPWDITRTPGTSSSGSAVAVSVGTVPVAIGSQTAGSIIRPASYCGVFGYKPSFGLIPRTGVLKTTDTLDTVGYFCGCLEDIDIVFDAVTVKGANYPISEERQLIALNKLRKKKLWRVGFVKTHTWSGTEDYIKNSLLNFIDRVSKLPTVEIDELILPDILCKAHDIHSAIYTKSLGYYFSKELASYEKVSDSMLDMIERGKAVSMERFSDSILAQKDIQFEMDKLLSRYDVLVSTSTASSAPRREEAERDDPSLMWTLSHLPALNIPIFSDPKGLPFGVQLVSKKYSDKVLLSFANFLEKNGVIPSRAPSPPVSSCI